ncbi:hypothetical protein [Cupriavidus taiwanensis]|uniref:hypothetical protein n=1 Tax=Cupriavidus TaxID=106589 RepID=UPI000E17ECCA|nr:hypothetical protein [Cupriavidus taiwanensis]SOY44475.1 conserved hypothetical protein [Cupriavidus taiwanensis]
MPKANAKRLSELRFGNDVGAINLALANGEITERQAQNMLKFIATATAIRENPLQTYPIQDQAGQFLGEVAARPDGTWSARRYGPEYEAGGAVLASAEEAERYVRGVPQAPGTEVGVEIGALDLAALLGEPTSVLLVAGLQALWRERVAARSATLSVATMRGVEPPAEEMFGIEEVAVLLRRLGATPPSI